MEYMKSHALPDPRNYPRSRPPAESRRGAGEDAPDEAAGFVDGYLPALLAQAHDLIASEFHAVAADHGLQPSEWRVLATLASGAPMSIGRLAQIVETFPYKPKAAKPKLLIVAPPPCSAGPGGYPAAGRSVAESERLSPLYRKLADELGHPFFDAGSVTRASEIDGVHLEAADTAAIGRALAVPVGEILG